MISKSPEGASRAPLHRTRLAELVVLLCTLVLVSTVWVETDLYRYVLVPLVAVGLTTYFLRQDFFPMIGPIGWACLLWPAHVALRYLWVEHIHPESTGGSAEGVYMFTGAYLTVGYIFFLYRDRLQRLLLPFFIISLVTLFASVQLSGMLENENTRVEFLFHNNLIHASIGAGFILIAAFCHLLWLVDRRPRELLSYWPQLGLLLAVSLFALLGIVVAASKGVWIALLAALPLACFAVWTETRGTTRLLLTVAGIVAILTMALVFGARIEHLIGDEMASAWGLIVELFSGGSVREVVLQKIESGALPSTFDERMRIWWNAMSIWRLDWLFGQGSYWENLWEHTRFADIGFELMHNSYLEVAIRFGIVGLVFYAILFGWCLYQMRRATIEGLVERKLYLFLVLSFVFFLVTMTTNSNIRLAIGESYMLVVGGFGFFAYYLRQWSATQPAS